MAAPIGFVALAYIVIGVLVALAGARQKLTGGVAISWEAVALAGLAWPVFLYVALTGR